MTDQSPRYRFWGERKPVLLARPAETVDMVAGAVQKTAKIRLYGPIDSWGAPFGVAASEVADALEQVGESTAVEMHVHSPGGDAFEGLAIMNLLRQHKGGVDMVVDGLAASAASIVAMGARTVTMAPGSQMMIHDASALAIGQADDLREAATMLDSISSNAADQYAAKTGTSADDMRAAMKATTWYKAQEAVDAGLADAVLADDAPEAAAAKAAAAALSFDLSMYARCQCGSNGADISATAGMQHKDECPTRSHQTPAEPPVIPPNPTEEADTMSDTIPKAGLLKALGLADDADEDTILDAIDAKTKAAQTAAPAPASLDAGAIKAALEADGKTVVSKNVLDELTAQAQAGAQARAKQLEEERDATITAAYTAGKISAERRDAWKASWDKDPEGTKADLESLPSRFPVAKVGGYLGDGGETGQSAAFTDDEAAALAQLAGVPKEALLNG